MTDDPKIYCNHNTKFTLLNQNLPCLRWLLVTLQNYLFHFLKQERKTLEGSNAIISSKSSNVWLQQCRRDKNRLRWMVVMEMTRIWQIVGKFREPSTVGFLS